MKEPLGLYSLEGCKELERLSSFSEEELMEKAAKGIAGIVSDKISKKKQVTILAGPGNNGGDGMLAAHFLGERGFAVQVFSDPGGSFLRKKQYERLQKQNLPLFPLQEFLLQESCSTNCLIDALFGAGCNRPLRGDFFSIIKKVQEKKSIVISVDIPSGIHGDTGSSLGTSIKADLTICIGAYKPGLFLREGYAKRGDLAYVDIGLPHSQVSSTYELMEEGRALSFLPVVRKNEHKYQAGMVIGFAGSSSMIGASKLASKAALRSGAGLVCLYHSTKVKTACLFPEEVMASSWKKKNWISALGKAKAVFAGPGMGKTSETSRLLSQLLSIWKGPLVLDADALFFLTKFMKKLPEDTILTPHAGEVSSLLGEEPLEYKNLQQKVTNSRVHLVLKGAPTVIFSWKEKPMIVARGSPGMATAGSGDVLTGMIAAILARGVPPRNAALLATFVHALSGEIAAEKKTPLGMIASDLVEAIPQAWKHLFVK